MAKARLRLNPLLFVPKACFIRVPFQLYAILIHYNTTECEAVKRIVGRAHAFPYNRTQMRKDAPLAFRIPADLKKKLLKLARQEARSLSQICEMLLKIGVEEYDKDGHKYLHRVFPSRGDDQG